MRIIDILERVNNTDKNVKQAVADGFNPKLWYHGTQRRFTAFRDPSLGSRERKIDELGPGIYLTGHRGTASWWSNDRGFIYVCVIRNGPFFDFGTANTPAAIKIMHDAHSVYMDKEFGPDSAYDDAMFAELLQKRGPFIMGDSLAHAGFIAGYKKDSQVRDQIVVFRPEDVRIVGRLKGGWQDNP